MELNQLTYSYDKKIDRVKAVNATIAKGKVTAIIGPNGSGKSTLLGLMARNLHPRAGEAVLDGKAIAAYKPKELARKLAVVHQHNEAPDDLTVERVASFGRLPYRSMWQQSADADREAVDWALACTNLLSKRHLRISQLSGGERQRVWIAMALAQQTPILLLDEPTTYLDVYYQIELLELIRRLNRENGLTIVMVLHDINQAIRYSDKLIVMKEGEAVLQGEPERIISVEAMKMIYGVEVGIRHDPDIGLNVVPIGIGG